MYNLKQLYLYKHNNLTSLIYGNDHFNNEDYDFKEIFSVWIWKKPKMKIL